MKKICLFTNSFPYGKLSEAFLEDEMFVASKLDVNIIIVPLRYHEEFRILPFSNITVCDKLIFWGIKRKIAVLCEMFFSKKLWFLPFSIKGPKTISDFYQGIKYLYGAFLIKRFVCSYADNFKDVDIFYSYWFNHTPLGLYWAQQTKRQLKNIPIYTRAHGFDVYERAVGTFFPYRKSALSGLEAVYVVSHKGCEYLKKTYPYFVSKIKVARLGVLPVEYKVKKRSTTIAFVSCSSVIPLKRVDLIYNCINSYSKNHPDLNVCWTHIGGGSNFDYLSQAIKAKVTNLEIILYDTISNKEVRKIYRDCRFDIFINLSTSEGIPVSIMEAISNGIPVIATNVGGTSEIVTKDTGLLLSVDFFQEEFQQAVGYILEHYDCYMKSSVRFYENNFNAQVNYAHFYNEQLV